MTMQKLLKSSSYVYNYLKEFKRIAKTYMTMEPQQVLCVKHIEGLGFNVKNKKKKEPRTRTTTGGGDGGFPGNFHRNAEDIHDEFPVSPLHNNRRGGGGGGQNRKPPYYFD